MEYSPQKIRTSVFELLSCVVAWEMGLSISYVPLDVLAGWSLTMTRHTGATAFWLNWPSVNLPTSIQYYNWVQYSGLAFGWWDVCRRTGGNGCSDHFRTCFLVWPPLSPPRWTGHPLQVTPRVVMSCMCSCPQVHVALAVCVFNGFEWGTYEGYAKF